jgi:hypothetical protein
MEKFKMENLQEAVATYIQVSEESGKNGYAEFMTKLQYSTIKFQNKFWELYETVKQAA